MATKEVNLRALRNEAAWLPLSLEEAVVVRNFLLDNGVTRAITDGIVTWLIGKAMGEVDVTDHRTRARYRKVLAEFESPLESNSLRAHSSVAGVFPAQAA